MLVGIPSEQLRTVLDECVVELLAEVAVTAPPVDALVVARRLGLVVAHGGRGDVRAQYVRLQPPGAKANGTVLLADEPRAERQHWAVAHEIGERLAHHVLGRLAVAPADLPQSARERLASQLANALLLPRTWFAEQGRQLQWDLRDLKRVFSTASHELLARRMLEMAPPVVVSLYDHGRLAWRRSNFLHHPPPPTSVEVSTWRSAHVSGQPACGEPGDFPEGVGDVRCWPIHEPHWRREILRTGLDTW